MNTPQFHLPTIFCRDNLEVLRGMDSETIDLIYLDPPFNKDEDFNSPLKDKFKDEIIKFIDKFNQFNANNGSEICDEVLKWRKDFAQPSFTDTWDSDDNVRQGLDWMATIADEQKDCIVAYLAGLVTLADKKCIEKGYLTYMAFMAVRLIEMKRVLKPTGSIYLHCDPTMSHWLKILMDMIFGADNFRNEIIWHYTKMGNPKRIFRKNSDTILFYSKDQDKSFFNEVSLGKPSIFYDRHKKLVKDNKLYYRDIKNTNDSLMRNKIKTFEKRNAGKKLNDLAVFDFSNAKDQMKADNVWNIPPLNNLTKERVGYPTQKPLALLERIIQASTNEGDVVLDPFCGCATACIAAHKLKRKYIGIDISKAAYVITIYRIFMGEYGGVPGTAIKKESNLLEYKKVVPRFTNQPPERTKKGRTPKKKYIYLIGNFTNKDMSNELKVGQTTNPTRRLSSYNTADPKRGYKIKFKAQYINYDEVEKAVLARYPRSKGEWIKIPKGGIAEVIAFIQSIGIKDMKDKPKSQ